MDYIVGLIGKFSCGLLRDIGANSVANNMQCADIFGDTLFGVEIGPEFFVTPGWYTVIFFVAFFGGGWFFFIPGQDD